MRVVARIGYFDSHGLGNTLGEGFRAIEKFVIAIANEHGGWAANFPKPPRQISLFDHMDSQRSVGGGIHRSIAAAMVGPVNIRPAFCVRGSALVGVVPPALFQRLLEEAHALLIDDAPCELEGLSRVILGAVWSGTHEDH